MCLEDGETLIEKSGTGTGWTTSVAGTECVRLPPSVPVMVRLDVPGATPDVVTVSVEGPLETELGVKVATAPAGRPDVTLRPTAEPNPFVGVTVTVYVASVPCVTVLLDGETPSEKSGV